MFIWIGNDLKNAKVFVCAFQGAGTSNSVAFCYKKLRFDKLKPVANLLAEILNLNETRFVMRSCVLNSYETLRNFGGKFEIERS